MMARIDCRNPECGFTRSATVVSSEGSHIPECVGCGDKPYTIPWDDRGHVLTDSHKSLDGEVTYVECSCGELFMSFSKEDHICPKVTIRS